MTDLGPWRLEQDGPLAVLTIDKPPLNLFDMATFDAFEAGVSRAQWDVIEQDMSSPPAAGHAPLTRRVPGATRRPAPCSPGTLTTANSVTASPSSIAARLRARIPATAPSSLAATAARRIRPVWAAHDYPVASAPGSIRAPACR